MVEIISNLASTNTDNTKALVQLGTIEVMVTLLNRVNQEVPRDAGLMRTRVLESAIWALGNIAGDNLSHRNQVNEMNAHEAIQALLKSSVPISIVRISIWALSNLPRGGRFPPKLLTLAGTAQQILAINDNEATVDALWVLSYLADGPDTNQDYVSSNSALFPELFKHLHPDAPFTHLVPALRTTGNLLTGSDEVTSRVLAHGAIQMLLPLLSHKRSNIQKETAWAFSNILGSIPDHINECIKHGVIKKLLKVATSRMTSPDVVKEILWAISNALIGVHRDALYHIVSDTHFPVVFAEALTHQDASLVQVAIPGMEKVVMYGQQMGDHQRLQDPLSYDFEIPNPILDFLYARVGSDFLELHADTALESTRCYQIFEQIGAGYVEDDDFDT